MTTRILSHTGGKKGKAASGGRLCWLLTKLLRSCFCKFLFTPIWASAVAMLLMFSKTMRMQNENNNFQLLQLGIKSRYRRTIGPDNAYR